MTRTISRTSSQGAASREDLPGDNDGMFFLN